jgi:hypothetical protein
MAILTKAQLEALNQSSFPDQSTEAITPAILRTYNTATIDTLVDSLDTGSFTTDVSALNAFTASQLNINSGLNASTASQQISINALGVATASLNTSASLGLVTASFDNATRNLTFTKGNTTQFSVNIPDVSGSAGNFVTTSSFNAYTASTDSSISQLNASSASQQTSINALNAATSSYATSAITASSLITASVSGQTMTFTKGNGTTFDVTLPTGSGGGSGNYATTGSNTFVGAQTISGSNDNHLYINRPGGNDILRLGVSDNGNTFDITLTGSANQQLWLIDNQGGNFGNVFQGFINLEGRTTVNAAFTASQGAQINGGNLRVSGNLTASLQEGYVWVGNASGITTTVATSSFAGLAPVGTATTGSNVFIGDQTISGSLSVSGAFSAPLQQGYAYVGNASGRVSQVATSSFGGGGSINTGSFATTGSNTFYGNQNINGRVNVIGDQLSIQGNLAGSGSQFANAQVVVDMVTDPANIYSTFQGVDSFNNGLFGIGMNSYGSEGPGGFFIFGGGQNVSNTAILSANANNNDVQFTKSNNNFSGNVNVTGSLKVGGSNVVVSTQTASFATTGSNVFTGDQTFIDSANNFFTITDTSGSMMLVGKSYTSASAHITSSVNQLNLLFKANGSTGETVISGSNNIFVNQNAPSTGFRKYVTAGNFALSANALPQFSSSMGFSPTVSSNIFANQSGVPMTVRGPVSSSAYTIQNNALIGGTVNLGSAAGTNFEKASNGFNMASNIINGTVSVTAYKTNFISSSAMAISSNNLGGATTLNADSSSITLAGNTIQNSGFVVNNSYYNASATGGGNSLQIAQGNGIFGGNTTIFASGSNTTVSVGRQFVANLLAGTFNSASLNQNGDNSNIFATAIIGHGLNVTGSSALQTAAPAKTNSYGSAFFGRFNAEDGNRARTAETVFAIGTGTTTTPKTGFLIDSGSNTFIEGSLNVSGSTTITGSLSVTNLIVSGSTQFNVGAFNSTITQSGSSAVSQSMTFNNTDITQGVSVVDTTKLTIANSGTYNIQFSAQLLADTGADTIWIWLKQNGTNVSNTATKLVLRNNEADVAAWNFVVPATANDYFELVWQNNGGHTKLLYEVASGNYPAIPSVIATVTQVK